METMKIHHIGYAVQNIEKAVKIAETLGFTAGDIVEDSIRNVKIAFIHNDTTCVELVASIGTDNPVSPILSKMGGATPYHICYEVESLDNEIQKMVETKKWIIMKAPEIAPAIQNRKVAFLYNSTLGIIELLETPTAV